MDKEKQDSVWPCWPFFKWRGRKKTQHVANVCICTHLAHLICMAYHSSAPLLVLKVRAAMALAISLGLSAFDQTLSEGPECMQVHLFWKKWVAGGPSKARPPRHTPSPWPFFVNFSWPWVAWHGARPLVSFSLKITFESRSLLLMQS